jgi:hypothetical protein
MRTRRNVTQQEIAEQIQQVGDRMARLQAMGGRDLELQELQCSRKFLEHELKKLKDGCIRQRKHRLKKIQLTKQQLIPLSKHRNQELPESLPQLPLQTSSLHTSPELHKKLISIISSQEALLQFSISFRQLFKDNHLAFINLLALRSLYANLEYFPNSSFDPQPLDKLSLNKKEKLS